MSEVNTQNQKPEQTQIHETLEEIDTRTLIKLINEAINNRQYSDETKYILILEEYDREGFYDCWKTYNVIYGEAEEVLLEEYYDNSVKTKKYMIVPKTVPVIIKEREYCDIPGFEEDTVNLYVFTAEGWKKVFVK